MRSDGGCWMSAKFVPINGGLGKYLTFGCGKSICRRPSTAQTTSTCDLELPWFPSKDGLVSTDSNVMNHAACIVMRVCVRGPGSDTGDCKNRIFCYFCGGLLLHDVCKKTEFNENYDSLRSRAGSGRIAMVVTASPSVQHPLLQPCFYSVLLDQAVIRNVAHVTDSELLGYLCVDHQFCFGHFEIRSFTYCIS
nr:hypothetical protein CFP56_64877 [Quercus suber]